MDPTSICRKARRLAGRQAELCQAEPEVVAELARGARLGIRECQFQFRFRRWNCSSHSKAFGRILQQGQCREGAWGEERWRSGEAAGAPSLPRISGHPALTLSPRPFQPPASLPHPSQSPRTQLWCCQLTAPPCLHRHPGDGLCVCYYCCRRQPRGHAGLLHGRAAAVWLPGTPWAGPATAPWPAWHPRAPRPRGHPRRQRCLGVGRLRGRRGLRRREVEALYGRSAQAGPWRHPCAGATSQQ